MPCEPLPARPAVLQPRAPLHPYSRSRPRRGGGDAGGWEGDSLCSPPSCRQGQRERVETGYVTLINLRIEGLPQPQAAYEKPPARITLVVKDQSFSSKIRSEKRTPALTTSNPHNTGSSIRATGPKKETKGTQTGKTILLANPRESTKTSKANKRVQQSCSIQNQHEKAVLFLRMSNE